MDSIWTDLVGTGVPVAEKVIRTIAVYGFLVIGLRLFGKRELGQLNPLDFIVLLLLSNTVQNAIIGNDNSLLGGLIGAAVLFGINEALVRFSFHNPRARRMIEGKPEELVRDGLVLEHAMKRNLISREELMAAARKQGVHRLDEVECARIEVSGALSFILREPTPVERYQQEIFTRLDAIEKKLSALAVPPRTTLTSGETPS